MTAMDKTTPTRAADAGTDSAPAIAVRHLCKVFGDVRAVDDVSFTVAPGQIVGLLGGNGAGKTTTIMMILGLLLPTAGDVRVLGHDMAHARQRALPLMNFSSPYVDLPGSLTVWENLAVYGRLYGVPQVRQRIATLADMLQLGAVMKRETRQLSAGQKTRVALAKALINRPQVLILDEPTASLDPDAGDWVRQILFDYARGQAATIFLASHNMTEVERLCDTVMVMRAGQIHDRGTPQELIARYGRETMEDVFLDIARGTGIARDAEHRP
jgi:ABC-2 type transport system ATP-binding protein